MPNIVTVTHAGEIAIVALNTPEHRNALSMDMRARLIDILRQMHADPACKAIVLTGTGGEFCAGGDLKESITNTFEPPAIRTPKRLRLLHDIVREIVSGPKAVVAAVDGHAYGAGMSIAAACDLVVAGPTAKFCAAFGRVGLIPDAGLICSLSQRMSVARSRQLILSARVLDAEHAEIFGLVDELAEAGKTIELAITRARQFANTAPLAASHVRDIFLSGKLSLEEVFASEMQVQPLLTASEDYMEARAAFAEKRKPVFVGR